MKRKWIVRSLAGFLLVFLIAFLAAALSLGTIIKRGVEKIGPSATKTDVKLKSAQVWLMAWRIQLTGFELGNPPGCKTPSAMDVGDVTVKFKPGTFFSDKMVIESIKVKSPVITLEGGLTDNNLRKIENNLNEYIGSSSTAPNSAAPPGSPAAPKKKAPEKRLEVDDLVITGAKLQYRSTLSGDRTLALALPDIHLTDLGSGGQGISPVEVGQRMIHALLSESALAVANNAKQLGKDAVAEGKTAVKSATQKVKSLFHPQN